MLGKRTRFTKHWNEDFAGRSFAEETVVTRQGVIYLLIQSNIIFRT